MYNRVVKALCIVMAIVFPASFMLAETRAAMAYANGAALLNGATLARSSAVFAGDKIETPSNSSVTLNANGSTIVIPANSKVQFDGASIQLKSGAAVVTTKSGISVRTDVVKVVPATQSAKFQVERQNAKVMVAALTGKVSVTDANGSTTVLDPGATKSVDDPQQDDSNNNGRKKGGGAPYPAVSHLGFGNGVLWGFVAAGVAASIAVATNHGNFSPDAP